MTADLTAYAAALEAADRHARAWLTSVPGRPVPARASIEDMLAAFGGRLPDAGEAPEDVVDRVATAADPGLMTIASGRFHGWVMGGTLPAALAADWLVSAWDQNSGMRASTPAVAAMEEVAGGWLLDLLGLPADASVGFTTGATMANVACLLAARRTVLGRVGWNDAASGLAGGPRVRVLVGEERHDTVDLALRYLGLGQPEAVAADEQGRIRVDALAEALSRLPDGEPLIVCLQAGNVHSGSFDPMADAVRLVHERGGWVHIDGAFGLWAAACPRLAHLADGLAGADSWATDAHKTLNVPYDCGIAVVTQADAMRAALGVHAAYLIDADEGPGNPFERVPELSRRGRGVPVYAALRSLGREGVAALVDGLARHAAALARGVGSIPGLQVLNDVVYTQVCIAAASDEETHALASRLAADDRVLLSPSRWRGRAVVRASVSNWSTDADDVAVVLDALRTAVGA